MSARAPVELGKRLEGWAKRNALELEAKTCYSIYQHGVGWGTAWEHLLEHERVAWREVVEYLKSEPECECGTSLLCVDCNRAWVRELMAELPDDEDVDDDEDEDDEDDDDPLVSNHIHLPSVHRRAENGCGFDYDEDLYPGRAAGGGWERIVRLVAIEGGTETVIRETFDVLCAEELAQLRSELKFLMEEGNAQALNFMQGRADAEFARQVRIAVGEEQACAGCGCSETRACSRGCVWASDRLCSKCAARAVAP